MSLNVKHYDFIEIGTSDFDTLIEHAEDNTVGLSVEPIKHYLDNLPTKLKVKKINCAIAFDNIEKLCNVYYLSEEVIKQYRLKKWLRGCNSINDYHYQHKHFKVEHLVTISEIQQIPISKLLIT